MYYGGVGQAAYGPLVIFMAATPFVAISVSDHQKVRPQSEHDQSGEFEDGPFRSSVLSRKAARYKNKVSGVRYSHRLSWKQLLRLPVE